MLRSAALLLACAVLAAADPAGPSAAVEAFRRALAAGDAAAAGALVVDADAVASARLARVARAMAAGTWDFSIESERVEGELAAVLVQGSRDRLGQPDRFPLFLVLRDGTWRLCGDPVRAPTAAAGDSEVAVADRRHLAALGAWADEARRPAPPPPAGESLATWVLGPATLGGRALRPGQGVPAGRLLAVGAARPARLVFNQLAGSSLSLSPGSQVVLREEAVEGGRDLVIDLEEGIVQVSVEALGPYAHVRVRSAASDVLVTGTVFLVQRAARGRDYVAQVDGTVRVRRRGPDGQPLPEEIRLTAHQGVEAGDGGFAPVDALRSRPQLTPDLLASGGLRAQGLAEGGGWEVDRIALLAPVLSPQAAPPAPLPGEESDLALPPPLPEAGAGPAAVDGPSPVLDSTFGVIDGGLGSDLGQAPGGLGSGGSLIPGPAGGGPGGAGSTPLADPPGFPD